MGDRWGGHATVGQLIYGRAAAVTPSDSSDLSNTALCLYIGGSGNVSLDTAEGNTVTFVGLTAGTILPVRTKRVRSTSTIATSIVALD